MIQILHQYSQRVECFLVGSREDVGVEQGLLARLDLLDHFEYLCLSVNLYFLIEVFGPLKLNAVLHDVVHEGGLGPVEEAGAAQEGHV